MLKIRHLLIVLGMLLTAPASAEVQVNIGINIPVYPDLVVVPGYPVYYAPQVETNLFFYDGLYWVYQDDYWYSSPWYNGPWWAVEPEIVPVFVLRIPVRYYRQPPSFFFGWRSDAPPRWGDHWGRDWERQRNGWDRWNRSSVPRPAPLPVYQREYSGDRYPQQVEQQQELYQQKYRYQPRDPVVRRQYQEEVRTPPAQQDMQEHREVQNNRQQRGQDRHEQAEQGRPIPQVEQRSSEERASGSMRQDTHGPGPSQQEQQSRPPRTGHDEQRAFPSVRQDDPRASGRQTPLEMQPSPRVQQMPKSHGNDRDEMARGTTHGPQQKRGQERQQKQDRND